MFALVLLARLFALPLALVGLVGRLFQAENPFELVTWLQGLTVGGSALAALWLTSFVYEKWSRFQALLPWQKLVVSAITSAVIGLGAYALLLLPPATLAALEPWIRVFVVSVSPFLAQQAWHAFVNRGLKSKTIELTGVVGVPSEFPDNGPGGVGRLPGTTPL